MGKMEKRTLAIHACDTTIIKLLGIRLVSKFF